MTRRGRYRGFRRFAGAAGAFAIVLAGACAPAWAISSGCTAVNSGALDIYITGNSVQTKQATGFDDGDTINITATATGDPPYYRYLWTLQNDAGATVASSHAPSVSLSYTVSGADARAMLKSTGRFRVASAGPALTVTATCTPVPVSSPSPPAPPSSPSPPASSGSPPAVDQVDQAQTDLSQQVVQIAGGEIGGAVSSAIDGAFGGGSPVSIGGDGVALFYAPETPHQRFDDAFAALGHDTGKKALPLTTGAVARAGFRRMWNVWADVRGAGLTGRGAATGTNGTQINVTAGLGHRLSPDLVVGLLGGYEHFDYGAASSSGNLKGHGASLGTYLGWRFGRGLRFEAAAVWSHLSYDATAGATAGSFDANRWLASGELSGSHKAGGFVWTPSARVFAAWEDQGAYTDSAASAHAAQRVLLGRVSGGLNLAYPWMAPNGATVTPSLGAYADYGFGRTSPASSGSTLASPGGVSGRVTAGLAVRNVRHATLSLGGALGGLGSTYLTWSADARAAVPF